MLHFLLTIADESDHSKIEYLYNKYHDKMMFYASSKFCKMGRDNFIYDAEDAVQNAFINIIKYLDDIDFLRNENDVKNYVFSILYNEIVKISREKNDVYEKIEEIAEENSYNFIERLEIKEKYEEVVNTIEKLDEKYSITLFLVYCQDMTAKQVADMMGISTKTVYTRLARGKKLLFESLKGEE